jgi:hypothetical protein
MLGVRDGEDVPLHQILHRRRDGLAGLTVKCGSALVAVGLC